MVFNVSMEPKEHPDWALVVALGGPVKVAERLGWTKEGSVQRVQNWKYRGIPSLVKLEHRRLFRPHEGTDRRKATEKAA